MQNEVFFLGPYCLAILLDSGDAIYLLEYLSSFWFIGASAQPSELTLLWSSQTGLNTPLFYKKMVIANHLLDPCSNIRYLSIQILF
jgi:hypothetical protein